MRRDAVVFVGRVLDEGGPGIAWAQARAAFDAEVERRPQPNLPAMIPLQQGLAGSARNASLMFMGGALLVLLIACTNVANPPMAGTADRTVPWSYRSVPRFEPAARGKRNSCSPSACCFRWLPRSPD